MLLASTLLPQSLVSHPKTAHMVIEVFAKHARLREAGALLRALAASGSAPLPFAHITSVLLALPQTSSVDAQDAADFVAAAVGGRSSFYEGQVTAVLLEFVTEVASALEAIRSSEESYDEDKARQLWALSARLTESRGSVAEGLSSACRE